MMNEPGTGEHMPIDMKTIEKLYIEPQDIPTNLVRTIHIDTAIKSAKTIGTGDSNAIVVVGHAEDGEVVYLDAAVSKDWQIDDFLSALSKMIWKWGKRPHRIRYLTDEVPPGDTFKGGSLWKDNLRSWLITAGHEHLPEFVMISRRRGKESTKILQSFSYWRDGKVKLVRGAPFVETLVEQAMRYGITGEDDLIRAFTDCFTPSIYKPIKKGMAGEHGETLKLPGDELLKGFRRPQNDDDYRYLYDKLMPPVKEEEWMR